MSVSQLPVSPEVPPSTSVSVVENVPAEDCAVRRESVTAPVAPKPRRAEEQSGEPEQPPGARQRARQWGRCFCLTIRPSLGPQSLTTFLRPGYDEPQHSNMGEAQEMGEGIIKKGTLVRVERATPSWRECAGSTVSTRLAEHACVGGAA